MGHLEREEEEEERRKDQKARLNQQKLRYIDNRAGHSLLSSLFAIR
jgi:hypothetical protein